MRNILIALTLCAALASQVAAESAVRVLTGQPCGTIPDAVYGQFIEHVGYCVNGPIGLWSEVIQDRKFYADLTNPASKTAGGWAKNWVHQAGMVRTDRIKAHSGEWCLELLPGGDTLRGWNGFKLEPLPGKKTVTLEGWCLRRETGDDNLPRLTVQAVDDNGTRTPFPLADVMASAAVPGEWHVFRQTLELPEQTASIVLMLSFKNGPAKKGSIFLDDLKFTGAAVQKGLVNGGFEMPDTTKRGNWSVIGNVTLLTGKQAFVGKQSPRLSVNSAIRQEGLGLRQNLDYQGRIILRGTPSAVCEVVLHGAESATSRLRLTGLQETWETRPLHFHADRALTNAALEIIAPQGEVTVGTLSLMPADNLAGWRRDVVEKMKELKAPNYRWPGGCYVGAWQWKDQLGDPDKRVPRNAEEQNDVGLHEYMALCKELATEPYICVNTGRFGEHGTPEYNRDLVLYCNSVRTRMAELRAKNGHPEPFGVKLFAIGNEMFGQWQYGHYNTVEEYAAKHNQTVTAMREADSSIRVVAVGNSDQMRNSAHTNWNRIMFQRCASNMDFISEHFYSTMDTLRGKDLFGHLTDLRDNLQACFDHYRRLYQETGTVKPIVLDEWTYWYGPQVYGPNASSAMFHKDGVGVAAALHAIYRNSDIVAGCNYSQTLNILGAICANRTDSAFSAAGLPLVLYRQHFGKHLVKSENPDPKLEVAAAWTADRKALTIALINLDQQPRKVPLKLEGFSPALPEATWYCLADRDANPDAQNIPGQNPALEIKRTTLSGLDVPLSPCTINVLVLPASPGK